MFLIYLAFFPSLVVFWGYSVLTYLCTMKRYTKIPDLLRPLAEAPVQAKFTSALQVADVLEWILEQVGPAEVWQTSFSISEEFLRRLYFIQKKHTVHAFHLVLDLKATNKTISLWSFIRQVMKDTALAANHSKLLLVKADSGTVVSVITSQNLTRGNRQEGYLITTDKGVFAEYHADLMEFMQYHSIPFKDIYEEKLHPAPSEE